MPFTIENKFSTAIPQRMSDVETYLKGKFPDEELPKMVSQKVSDAVIPNPHIPYSLCEAHFFNTFLFCHSINPKIS